MSRVFYEDLIVLRHIPWTERNSILSALGKNTGLLSISLALPKKNIPGKEKLPSLFSTIRATLQKNTEGFHKLRSFETLQAFRETEGEDYLKACLLGRATMLMARESPLEGAWFSLWLHFFSHSSLIHSADLLADIHYAHGTWSPLEACESCGAGLEGGVCLLGAAFACQTCGHGLPILSKEAQSWLTQRYRTREWLDLPYEDVKLLRRFLLKRLPDNLAEDKLFSRMFYHLKN